ncbi:MAG TPA: OmpA family protein [Rhizomicrobium sp.]|nr:OmpA family protein [Rhizomicrobium sp.]
MNDDDNRWLRSVAWLVAVALILFLVWWLWPPMANPDHAAIVSGQSDKAVDVLANDYDLFGRRIYIKSWSNGANGGRVALVAGKLNYRAAENRGVTFDVFSYTIWTGHGFPATASVAMTINGNGDSKPSGAWVKITQRLPETVSPAPSPASVTAMDCPRGRSHSTDPATPAPKQYGNCFAIYFSWDNGKVFAEHRRAIRAMLSEIAKEAAGKAILINGYTDTSGVHYAALSKARACSVADALKADGLESPEGRAYAVGIADPAVTTPKDVRERLNRRVEIRILSATSQPTTDVVQCGG